MSENLNFLQISQPINNPIFSDPESMWVILYTCLPFCNILEIIVKSICGWLFGLYNCFSAEDLFLFSTCDDSPCIMLPT